MSNSKQDRQGARTPADLERKYNFGKTFEEVYGIAKSAQKSASEATVSVDKLDNSLNQEEIFKRLTTNDNGEKMQGVFMEDGEMYINAKYIANVEELFAKNITMTGKFTTTAEVFLEPGEEECAAMREIIASHITIPPTAEQLALYDANGDGTIDVIDLVKFRFACLGRASLIDLWEGTSELKKSTVTITIDINNPAKAIRMNGTNMWGREIDQYFGVNSAFMNDNVSETFDEFLRESSVVATVSQGGTGATDAGTALSNLGGLGVQRWTQTVLAGLDTPLCKIDLGTTLGSFLLIFMYTVNSVSVSDVYAVSMAFGSINITKISDGGYASANIRTVKAWAKTSEFGGNGGGAIFTLNPTLHPAYPTANVYCSFVPISSGLYFNKYESGETGVPDGYTEFRSLTTRNGQNLVDANFSEDIDNRGCYYRTISGVKEWINPPMVAGTEYRTTERHLGKVVYVKNFDCGICGKGRTSIAINLPSNYKIVRYFSEGSPFFYGDQKPGYNPYDMWVSVMNAAINVHRNDSGESQCYCTIFYTKD